MSTKMAQLISEHDYKMTRSTLSFFFYIGTIKAKAGNLLYVN